MIDGRIALAGAIIFSALLFAWMFRYETVGNGLWHRNRLTGTMCAVYESCW